MRAKKMKAKPAGKPGMNFEKMAMMAEGKAKPLRGGMSMKKKKAK